ncbi:MAG: CPBP family intramembrane glutamic endopeptidase [Luteolibacter sp.]|uniref:CPBP family intramembrane glutamic endopeptidase n=1 Tax=Luteolibacter sp. TaxID=1962973 RepID=UPI003264CEDE
MRDEALSDVLKVWLYVAAFVLLGAWISPLLYNAGKALAEVSATKETNGPLKWLADQCRATHFPGFFKLALMLSAGVLFFPLVEWLHGGRASERGKVGFLRLPEGARSRTTGQRLKKNPQGMLQAVAGFVGVTLLFFLIATILVFLGVFEWKSPTESMIRIVLKVFATSILLAVVQEILFRSVAMGIFLRAMRPAWALGMTAVIFALVYFLNPPPGLNVLDPEASGIGFEMLRKIAGQFSEPQVVIASFTPMLALGGMLAYARWETASLFLPVGLHAGWIFINGIISHVTLPVSHPDTLVWLLSGSTLQQGLLPLAGIIFAGGLVVRLTSTPADAHETTA